MKRHILLIIVLLVVCVTVSGCTMADAAYTINQTYLQAIAEGKVPGHYAWSKVGYNPSIGTTEEVAWSYSTNYTFPNAPMQMTVVSSNNVADIPGGTGAQEVTISYLDAGYNERTEVVEINGTTPVATTSINIFRVNNFRVTATGTGGKAAGNISLQGAVDAIHYSYILAGRTRAMSMIYTVPAGKTLYITSIAFSCSDAAKGVKFTNMATYDNVNRLVLTPGIHFMGYTELVLFNTAYNRLLELPTKLPETTDIKVVVVSGLAGAEGGCSLRGWLEDN